MEIARAMARPRDSGAVFIGCKAVRRLRAKSLQTVRAGQGVFAQRTLIDGSQTGSYAAPIDRFIAAGALKRSGDLLRLTRRGVLVSNEVLQEFVTT